MKGSTELHQQLVDDVLFRVGSMPRIRVWPRHVGFDQMRNIKYGVPGEADIQGIISPQGRALAIECKSGDAVLQLNQKRWKNMWVNFGGLYILARDADQVVAEIVAALI